MVPQSWIINCLKMYKISLEIINLIEKTMKNWRVKLTAGGKSLAETKIPREIFQGEALTPILFIIAMTLLNHIPRKCSAGYKLSRSQEKINHLMYMDDIKLFAKNEKELETLIHTVWIYSQNIGMEFGIEKCALLVMKSGKRHLTDGIEVPNQDKIRTLAENETYKYLGILEAATIKQVEMKNKIQKEYLRRTSVVYWHPTRPNMPFQRLLKCIFHWRGRAWLTIWDGVKIPRYSHKLMHRKRVTCELHDSYFRSMTIKHSIPKTAEAHFPMASYGEILSERLNYYITRWIQEVS